MRKEFNAKYVSVEEDAHLWMAGFAESEYGSRRRLLLRRDRAPSDEDRQFGLDGYQVEVDDENQSCYGGIETFELFPDHARVEFEDDAVPQVGGEKVLVMRFDLRERQLAQLRRCLSRIFAGHDCFLDRSG